MKVDVQCFGYSNFLRDFKFMKSILKIAIVLLPTSVWVWHKAVFWWVRLQPRRVRQFQKCFGPRRHFPFGAPQAIKLTPPRKVKGQRYIRCLATPDRTAQHDTASRNVIQTPESHAWMAVWWNFRWKESVYKKERFITVYSVFLFFKILLHRWHEEMMFEICWFGFFV